MILVDLNVLLDVIQRREPHYPASAAVLDEVVREHVQAVLPAHVFTTLHYLVGRHQSITVAHEAVDWLLAHFDVVSAGREELVRARALGWRDFEDGVVAAAAEFSGCAQIVTRNVRDFVASSVPAVTPEEFLAMLGETE
jgi:predicted nucleic acid-binding protein